MKGGFMSGWEAIRGVPESLETNAPGGGGRRWATVSVRHRRPPLRLLLVVMLGLVPGMVVVAAGSPVATPSVTDNPVARGWLKHAMAREREHLVEKFARDFSIGPDLAGQIYTAARTHDIEPVIAFGLVRTESSFRRTVVSHAGAVGYTQLLPSTARWIAPGTTRTALFDAETNLDVGFRYLRYLKDKYDGDVDLALTAYNRGQGRVDRLLRSGRNPDNGYSTAVRTGHVSRTLIRQNSPRG